MFSSSFFMCFFKHKTAYELRISDWSSDVCSSDLAVTLAEGASAEDHKPATILVHQPSGCDLGVQGRSVLDWIVPGNQAPDDASGRHFVKRDLKGLEPAMPLEPGASGMVVYTQAFAIGRKLTEDSARIEHAYLVDVDGELASDGLKRPIGRATV